MACNDANVPAYLHWNNRKTFELGAFKKEHYIYRVGWKDTPNPIEYPNCLTSLSCKWARLIKYKDVLRITPERLGDLVLHSTVAQINQINIASVNDDLSHYPGLHSLSCQVEHRPLDCDYSHVEIQIVHSFPGLNGGIEKRIYSHADWNDSACLLKSKRKFFKAMRLEYRSLMTAAFYPGKPQRQNWFNKVLSRAWIRIIMPVWLQIIEPLQASKRR